jgi:hypothetical protein
MFVCRSFLWTMDSKGKFQLLLIDSDTRHWNIIIGYQSIDHCNKFISREENEAF